MSHVVLFTHFICLNNKRAFPAATSHSVDTMLLHK